MAFMVGQRVACIAPVMATVPGEWTLPNIGVVYTIRDMWAYADGIRLGLYLEEIRNPIEQKTNFEPCFDAKKFRPVVERKTDTGMAILRKLLDTKQRENVLCGND